MRYISVPKELRFSEIQGIDACFAPGRYVRFIPPSTRSQNDFAPLNRLIILRESRIIPKKDNIYRYAEIGDIDVDTGGIVFRQIPGYRLPTNRPSAAKHGDVLVSTVRTYRKGIGCVSDDGDNLVTTNAVLNICGVTDFAPNLTLLYIYSFLRTDFFVEQVWSLLNRGLYPRMDKGALDKILIPISPDKRVIRYVSALMQAIVEKEKNVRDKNQLIHSMIEAELAGEQKMEGRFSYAFPAMSEISALGRLDASMYTEAFKRKEFLLRNYALGCGTYSQTGFDICRGQNLQVSCIGKSIYSDEMRPNFYRLLLPTHITDVGTVSEFEWLGNSRSLSLLLEGDIVFGGEATFRCVVACDALSCPTISNIHAILLRSDSLPLHLKIFAGAWLRYLGEWGYVKAIAVGGQGGSIGTEYFDHLPIPKFPDEKQGEIARLYHYDAPPPPGKPTLDTLVAWHKQWNKELGIWELDREMKNLQRTLWDVQQKIINGKTVAVPL